jgi:hypothetical protein
VLTVGFQALVGTIAFVDANSVKVQTLGAASGVVQSVSRCPLGQRFSSIWSVIDGCLLVRMTVISRLLYPDNLVAGGGRRIKKYGFLWIAMNNPKSGKHCSGRIERIYVFSWNYAQNVLLISGLLVRVQHGPPRENPVLDGVFAFPKTLKTSIKAKAPQLENIFDFLTHEKLVPKLDFWALN